MTTTLTAGVLFISIAALPVILAAVVAAVVCFDH